MILINNWKRSKVTFGCQQQRTHQENLVNERDTEIREIRHQLETVRNQLTDVQQQKTHQENLVKERDTEIHEIRHQLETVQTQLTDVQQQKTRSGTIW